jgi:apolipoprotein D and lipocalin family protein
MSRTLSLLIGAVVIALQTSCGQPPVNRKPEAPLAVKSVNTETYLGAWHEAARLPNSFERDCVAARANYALRADGLIAVENTCVHADGTTRSAEGRARRVGTSDEGKFKVSFFGPFWGDYWVVDRAPDYSWSFVGEPSGRYFWVLTRDPHITPQARAAFTARAEALGYDTSKFVWNNGP